MSVWFTTVYALLACAGAMVLVRMWLGPSMLDRAVALDALLSIAVAAIGTLAAQRETPFFLPVLLVLAFLGFTGSVSIARFISVQDRKAGPGEDGKSGTREHG
ncbi:MULTISPECIES: monovalent cation/H+ antiporter complex subunit F [Streptomyces]|uniref:Cation:proton antiporter n=1 Tax=Streptomyces lycii TaxID=2654337 RepID=A0ABQ7FM44_9ACTN|nr:MULTISPECIES: monovalent cation/H+ antiporter complex subunit F [Streptomyces]KAF4409765.1 hypothetical protein GCU69_07320 [Streptomyces lycii]PGH47873.1 hypothetical protein CRI70_26165 [Streptomyces sp. Ru87]